MNTRWLWMLICLAMLSACDTTRSLMELRQAPPPPNAYDATLAAGYRDLSSEQEKAYAWWDSKYFADKGLLAASSHSMLPEDPAQWGIAETQLPEFRDARGQLLTALESGRLQQPEIAAAAVLAYDRWIVLGDAAWDTPRIEEARDHFFSVLGKLKQAMEAKTEESPASEEGEEEETKAEPAPAAPAPTPAPVEVTSTIIYFPFKSVALDDTAKKALKHLVEYIRSAGNVGVVIHGHTDSAGSEEANVALSKKRAEIVAQALRAQGIPEKEIRYFAFGESDLKVPTKDGVREKLNRRVEVFIE